MSPNWRGGSGGFGCLQVPRSKALYGQCHSDLGLFIMMGPNVTYLPYMMVVGTQ